MKFSELSSLPVVHLYAGDIPDKPEYRSTRRIGLSLKHDDGWHIRHDISKPLPIPDESVDTFQAEDVFEHIPYEKLPATLSEIFRVLKTEGLFRLSVPDYRCDILYNRSIKDANGNIVFDPLGGGTYRRKLLLYGEKRVLNGGHVWFPSYEKVLRLLRDTQFSSVDFLHYYDENWIGHTKPIDYTRGFVQRTPDHDARVSSPFRPMSIVVDCIK